MYSSPLVKTALIAALLFAVTFILGWTACTENPAIGEKVLIVFKDHVASEFLGENPPVVAVKLFLNNLEVCILLFLGGASAGIVTLLILGLNGLAVGIITEFIGRTKSLNFMFAAILPHGIFEIPSFLLSAALGIIFAQTLLYEWYGEPDIDTGNVVRQLARILVLVVVPLVAIAALVEAFITPEIIKMVV
jgi:stage II sporulation protein M